MPKSTRPKAASMSNFAFFAMTASLFITVFEYPTFAQSHKTLIFFLLFCGIFWFLPVALCSAELATIKGFQDGGIFSWVGKPLSEKFGFAAIFFQWFQITVSFVTMIYFIIGTIAYIFKIPELNNNLWIKFLSVVIIFWVLTFLQFGGAQRTAKIARYGFSLGIILPVVIMSILAIRYFLSGHAVSSSFTNSSFIPKGDGIAALTTFTLAYVGVEASAPHISNLANPNKTYPKMLILLVIVGIVVSTIGGSIVSMVLTGPISANEGVMHTIEELISPGKITLPVIILGLLIVFGIASQVSSWIVSPTAGLQYVAKEKILPKKFEENNKHNAPVPILIMQAIVVTIWAALLTFGSGGSGGNMAFQTAISLTVLIYLSAYILLFIAYLKVIYSKDIPAASYQMPGGRTVKTIVGSIGLLVSIASTITAFIAPASIASADRKTYVMMLASCYIVTLLIPFVIYYFSTKHNKNKQN